MTNPRHIWLIARRDFIERVATKAFRFGTVVMMMAVAASVILPAVLSSDETPVRTVAVAGPAPEGLTDAITQLGPASGTDIRIRNVESPEIGEQLLKDDQASVVLVPGKELITAESMTDSPSTSSTAGLVASVNEVSRLFRGLESVGLSSAQSEAVIKAPPLEIRALQTADASSSRVDSGTAAGVVIAVFIFLLIYTAWVVNGVIEEKTSRVVEVLLSTIKAQELLTGKVLGTALVAGLQGVALVATVLASQMIVEGKASANIGLDLTTLIYGLVWVIVGYLLYAWMYAAAGSMATRSQDAQSLTFPIQIPLLLSYVMSVGAAVGGGSQVVTVLSYIPFTAPMAMLTRMTIGDAAGWEIALSLGLTLATAALVMRITVVIYTGSILRTGQKTKLRDAWKAARN